MAEEYSILKGVTEADLPPKGKLRWNCRRGMKELEVLLLPFLDQCYDNLPLEKKIQFVRMLGFDDASLYSWFMGYETPDDAALTLSIHEVQYAVANLSAGEAGPHHFA